MCNYKKCIVATWKVWNSINYGIVGAQVKTVPYLDKAKRDCFVFFVFKLTAIRWFVPSGFFYGEIRMDMFRKLKSIFGYENNDDEKNKIDSYGVDHSNFSLRDEIEYQMALNNR